jgi:hypothetical protein
LAAVKMPNRDGFPIPGRKIPPVEASPHQIMSVK